MTHRGSCLCGAVTFQLRGALKPPDMCHCTACRKTTGHTLVSTDVSRDALDVSGMEHVRWYQSSKKVRRGFCGTCGSTLFWDPVFHDWTAVAMGAFDTPTETEIAVHIFVREKGDYYCIDDGKPQRA